MEKIENKHVSWLGLSLTKKRAMCLAILSSSGSAFFATSIMFTLPVLQYNLTYIYPNDKLAYFYTLLLFISNLIASSICICIFSYTLSKVRTFRKSLKKQ